MAFLRVTAVELDSEAGPPRMALDALEVHIARHGSELLVLPELPFTSWFMTTREPDDGTWAEAVAAHDTGLAALRARGGPPTVLSVPRARGGRRHHDALLVERGAALRLHTKSYLPDEAGAYEASWYEGGDGSFTVHPAAGTLIGVLMCSEAWYPEHARAMGRAGATLIAAPRATHASSLDRWVAALRVVAIVSGAYVVSSNRAGLLGRVAFAGAGMVIAPDGRVLATTSPDCPFVTVDVDLESCARARREYPCNIVEPPERAKEARGSNSR
jgi:N-carbamoylputrescine amidase